MRRLALLLGVEGGALVVIGAAYGVASLTDDSDRPAALAAAGSAVLTGVLLVLLARGVAAGRGWARGPALTLNVFALPVAALAFQAGTWWVGAPIVLLAGTVLYLFATPDVRARFSDPA